jgi:hypothetical protein
MSFSPNQFLNLNTGLMDKNAVQIPEFTKSFLLCPIFPLVNFFLENNRETFPQTDGLMEQILDCLWRSDTGYWILDAG